MTPTDGARALKVQGLSKARLYASLDAYGFRLGFAPDGLRAELDRLIRNGRGWILPQAVLDAAERWGWSPEQVRELRKALR